MMTLRGCIFRGTQNEDGSVLKFCESHKENA